MLLHLCHFYIFAMLRCNVSDIQQKRPFCHAEEQLAPYFDTGKHLGSFQHKLKLDFYQTLPKMLLPISDAFIGNDKGTSKYSRMFPIFGMDKIG